MMIVGAMSIGAVVDHAFIQGGNGRWTYMDEEDVELGLITMDWFVSGYDEMHRPAYDERVIFSSRRIVR